MGISKPAPDIPVGTEYGKLTTVGLPYYHQRYRNCDAKWEVMVQCSCPAQIVKHALVWQLQKGKTVSCGCHRKRIHTKVTSCRESKDA
jgi:hypothetical protein